jgi:hypothetical protein
MRRRAYAAEQEAMLSASLSSPLALDKRCETERCEGPVHYRAPDWVRPAPIWVSRHRRCPLCKVRCIPGKPAQDSVSGATLLKGRRSLSRWSLGVLRQPSRPPFPRCVQSYRGRTTRMCCTCRLNVVELYCIVKSSNREVSIGLGRNSIAGLFLCLIIVTC